MQQLSSVVTLHPDGETVVHVEYTTEPSDPASGIFSECVVIHDVYLETGESVWEDLEGDLDWHSQVSKFVNDPWYADYNPYTDPARVYDNRADSPETEVA